MYNRWTAQQVVAVAVQVEMVGAGAAHVCLERAAQQGGSCAPVCVWGGGRVVLGRMSMWQDGGGAAGGAGGGGGGGGGDGGGAYSCTAVACMRVPALRRSSPCVTPTNMQPGRGVRGGRSQYQPALTIYFSTYLRTLSSPPPRLGRGAGCAARAPARSGGARGDRARGGGGGGSCHGPGRRGRRRWGGTASCAGAGECDAQVGGRGRGECDAQVGGRGRGRERP